MIDFSWLDFRSVVALFALIASILMYRDKKHSNLMEFDKRLFDIKIKFVEFEVTEIIDNDMVKIKFNLLNDEYLNILEVGCYHFYNCSYKQISFIDLYRSVIIYKYENSKDIIKNQDYKYLKQFYKDYKDNKEIQCRCLKDYI